MKSRGFTLVELLVVLVIAGLLLSLAPAAFNRLIPSVAMRSSARDVAASFRDARGLAIRDNRETVVLFDVEEGVFGREGGSRNYQVDPAFKLALRTAESEQRDSPDGEGVGGIRFFPDGTSTGGRVTLSRQNFAYFVTVDWLTGRVDIDEGNLDDES